MSAAMWNDVDDPQAIFHLSCRRFCNFIYDIGGKFPTPKFSVNLFLISEATHFCCFCLDLI